nr:Calx-beta domain-containing protein [uncultured Psychroserpens sp.]
MKHFYLFLMTLFIGSFGFAQTTVTYEFSSGAVTGLNEPSPGITVDPNIGFGSFKNSGTSNPALISGQLRLYQNGTKGGSIIIYANNGATITNVTVYASSRTGDAGYTVDGGSATNLSGGSTYTMSSISANTEVEFYQRESGSGNRIYVDSFEVTYTMPVTCTAPTTQASLYNTTALGTTTATLNWTPGNGDEVLVLVKEGSAVDTDPESGTAYTGNTTFTSGDQIGTGNYAIYSGSTTSSVGVTGLNPNTTYHVAVYEYNTIDTCYELTELTGDFTTADITKVQFTSTSASVAESAGTYDLVIEIANEDIAATTFDVVLTSGDATDIDSYTTQSETFPGSSTTDVTVTITVTDDAIIETDEVFTFEIQSVAGGNSAIVGTNNAFDLTITNNDFPTTVEFISSSDSVSEGVGTYDLEFTIANESATVTSFEVALIGGDGDAADINSYTTQTVTFPSGTSANQTATLTITDDMIFEGDETLIFEIQNVSGGNSATIGTESTFTLTMTDNDTPPPCNSIFADDFSGDLSDWSNTGDWTINSGELKHDLSGTSGSSYIYTDLGVQDYSSTDYEWGFCVSNGNWDPSSGNKFAFTLFSDASNLLSTPTGYAVGVNQTDTSDDLKLYSVNNGVYTQIVASTFDWSQNEDVCIRVTRSASGAWELFYNDNGAGETSAGTTTNTTYTSGNYLGTTFDFSSTRAGLLYIDDVNVCKVEVVSLNDTDTEVYEPTSQVEAATITAANSTPSGTAFDALGFEVEDLGTADVLPTNITTMRFVPGPNNTADWTDHIQGVTLLDGNLDTYTPTTIITDTEIILTFGSPIEVAGGTTLEFLLGLYLNTTAIEDDSVIQLQIDGTSSGFDADLSGSDFADPFLLGDVVGNNMTIDVDATELSFTAAPSDVFINDTMSPSVEVSYVDANGNIDTDYTGTEFDISLTTDGSFDASAVIVAEATNGVATFNSLIFDTLGIGLKLTATDDSTFIAGTFDSTTFNVNPIPINGWQITAENTAFVIDFDTTVTEVNNGAFDASGFTPSPTSGQLDSDAWAATGMSDGSLNFGDTQTSGDYANGTSIGNETGGGFYAFNTVIGNSTLGFQATGSDFTPGTITLRAQNQTGTTVTVADLAYLIYVNNNEGRSTTLDFSYSTDDSSYSDIAALDYSSDTSADGSGWVSSSKSTNITGLSIADGEYLYLRWSSADSGGSGSRDEFALDDISLNFNPIASTTYTYTEIDGWLPSDPNGVATASDDIVITTGDATISSNTSINTVTVNPGASLTIDVVATLTVTDNFTLESVSNSYSSLILDGTITGTVNYSRHINTTASTSGNDLISAPLTGQTFTSFVDANSNIVSNNDNSLYLFGPFEKPTNEYITYGSSETATLDPAIGYRAASTDDGNFIFTGTVNKTDKATPIVSSGTGNTEWNLIGNPYPSYITLSEFLAQNGSLFTIERSGVYGYDGDASTGWTIWNQAYSDFNSGALIAPGQGFLVTSKAAGGTVNFTTGMRSSGDTDDFIEDERSSTVINISQLKLQITNSTKMFNTDFYFNDTATLGLNPGYDSGLLGSVDDFALYSHLVEENTGLALGIQTLNNTNLITEVVIPLGVNANQGEQLTFSIAESTLAGSVNVYLEDDIANTSTLLTTGDYILTPNTNLSGTGRFFLRFTEEALSTVENSFNNLNIYTSKATKEIVVNGQLIENTICNIYDIQGRLVSRTQLNHTTLENRINISTVSTGIYIVKLQSNNFEKTQKLIIE